MFYFLALGKLELLNEYKNLKMQEKIPFIRKSFELQQTDKDTKYISLKEKEQLQEFYGKPKHYVTAYLLFCAEQSSSLKEGLSFSERSKILSQLWKDLNEEEKEEFNKKFAAHKKKYEKKYAQYLDRIPNELVVITNDKTHQNLISTPYNLFKMESKNPTGNLIKIL